LVLISPRARARSNTGPPTRIAAVHTAGVDVGVLNLIGPEKIGYAAAAVQRHS